MTVFSQTLASSVFGGPDRPQAVTDLHHLVSEFVELDARADGNLFLYHWVLARVEEICAQILECERAGFSRDEIRETLGPLRRIRSRSPFVRRLQQWPGGHPGDFETIESLRAAASRAAEGSQEWIVETHALSRSIAEQYRNKVQHQAARIVRTLLDRPGKARIFSLASGSCPDLRLLVDYLPGLLGELWLNDTDLDALQFSTTALGAVGDRTQVRPGHALTAVLNAVAENAAFDLVLAGGLFDFLPEKHAIHMIRQCYGALAPGGTFFFTNIAEGNHSRPPVDHFGGWFLIERSEKDLARYCQEAGVPLNATTIRREETGLTLLIETTKPIVKQSI